MLDAAPNRIKRYKHMCNALDVIQKIESAAIADAAKRMGQPRSERSGWALAKRLAEKRLRAGYHTFFDVEASRPATVPLMASAAECGFLPPADDYLDRPLDFNELLIENLGATFAVGIVGESMTGAALFPGDIAVVDRSRTAVDGSIVLALLAGEFTVKRYRKKGARTWLQAENPAFGNIEVNEDSGFEVNEDPGFEVWGVIAKSIRML
jgi:DNA polymerase V